MPQRVVTCYAPPVRASRGAHMMIGTPHHSARGSVMLRVRFVTVLGLFVTLSAGSARGEEKIAHRVLAADKGRVAIVNDRGEVEWEAPNRYTCHDIAMLPNGNVLFPTGDTTIVEMTPEKK